MLVLSQCGQGFDFNVLFSGRISYFTHPPETHTLPTHISAEIVTEMGKAFDWDELEKGNQEVLAGRINLNGLSDKTGLTVQWMVLVTIFKCRHNCFRVIVP